MEELYATVYGYVKCHTTVYLVEFDLRLEYGKYLLKDHRLIERGDPRHIRLVDVERDVTISMVPYSIEITGTIERGTKGMIPIEEISAVLVGYIPTS